MVHYKADDECGQLAVLLFVYSIFCPIMPRKTSDTISASQDWRNRMAKARSDLPKGIGQKTVIEYVVEQEPKLDKLTNFFRRSRVV